jgi:membrane protein
MNRAEKTVRAIDRLQQRVPWLAFPVAVWKKFGDDQAGNLAALLAYYAFASLFPLLLVFVTVLDMVLRDFPSLRTDLLNSAFGQFPVIGDQLRHVHTLHETGAALVVGLLLTFLGARGVAGAAQNALNTVWAVPYSRRPGFPWNQLRSIGLIVVVGLGLVITSTLSTLAAGSAQSLIGPAAHVGAVIVSLVLNVCLFWFGFRLATARAITTRELFLGAALSGVIWQILQVFGGYIVGHQVAHASAIGGVFAVVLGLLAWLYLQAQCTLYALEASVVKARRLWPRSLVQPPLTPQDRQAYQMYVHAEQRRPEESIDVRIESASGGPPSGE